MREQDERDFEDFVREHGTSLMRTAVLLVGDHGHAEDLVQTALERVARRWARLDPMPVAYARATLVNLSTDRWRRRAARPVEVHVDVDTPSGDDTAEAVATRAAVLQALAVLPPLQRAVIVLRHYEGLSETETAAALKVSVGTVKNSGSRARARLRAELSGAAEEVR